MSELALELIREAKRTKAKKLDLGNCGLTELPDELFELVWLEELYLCNFGTFYFNTKKERSRFYSKNKGNNNNNIIFFPPEIQLLKELKILLANNNISNKWDLEDLSPLSSMQSLQYLSVPRTSINNIDALKGLKKLQELRINQSSVKNLSALEKNQELKLLSIYRTEINDLSPLSNLQNLEELNIHTTKISNLEPLKNLSNLQNLNASGTQINDLSPLKSLQNLKVLRINKTKVSNLKSIEKLSSLQILNISQTQINDLSPLRNLQNLKRLDISNTQVSNLKPLKKLIEKGIPVEWSTYEGGINIENCPLTNPPIHIAKQSNKAILNYWKQIEDQGGTKTIDEAKLIIVGEGGTGKTTLFNKLINPAFDLHQTPTKETQGINIKEGLEIKEGFKANLWDFGGQELQYMTHQFFLSPDAVYVLMMEARGEAPNLAYWFKIISLLGKDKSEDKVSLIIVLNKKKGSTGMPQYQDLLKIYENDFDYQFIEVDLAVNDKRWECLRETIEDRLVNLPIVKNKLPKKWSPIREALRVKASERPYINAGRLHDICKPFKVSEEADQFLMTEYLHKLGSLLHFQGEEDNLMDLIVLSPEWVVEAVYTVLKNERIKEELQGKFTANDMISILCKHEYNIGDEKKKYSKVDAQKLIQLMSKHSFDICYKSKSDKYYVAAQLLPPNRPNNFKWNKDFNIPLQFRYQYPIMPKGLMSRLIVRLSGYLERIDGQDVVWKKGAILNMEFDGSKCRVLMREDDGESRTGLKQIIIEVLENEPFSHRKYALQRVRDEIESLHNRWFENITSEQIVPCNCSECKDSNTPFTYKLTQLKKLKKGRAYCNVQEDFVPLQQLLEGVYDPEEIKSFAHDERKNRYDK